MDFDSGTHRLPAKAVSQISSKLEVCSLVLAAFGSYQLLEVYLEPGARYCIAHVKFYLAGYTTTTRRI